MTADATRPRTDAAWLDAHWMPYTGNRQFKANPRMIVSAHGAYYTDIDGKQILDGLSGLCLRARLRLGLTDPTGRSPAQLVDGSRRMVQAIRRDCMTFRSIQA